VPPARTQLTEHMMRHLERGRRPEFVVLYLNDADRAGHDWGWMSPAYLAAAAGIDSGLGFLGRIPDMPDTLAIVTADHGGGGVEPTDHDSPHPVNDEIPLCLLGRAVVAPQVGPLPVSLLDIPPTVLHGLGIAPPANFAGRVLREAFDPADQPADPRPALAMEV